MKAKARKVAATVFKVKSAASPLPLETPAPTWFVYILRCADQTLYTGITTDIARRRDRHNSGLASRYTRSRRPVEVVYRETQPTRSHALKREAAIKSMPRAVKERLIRDAN